MKNHARSMNQSKTPTPEYQVWNFLKLTSGRHFTKSPTTCCPAKVAAESEKTPSKMDVAM